ncbi:hypothetical protein [Priestia megaterium]|uniref:hypothetical protein n=1 Tax=Priestia megaterium TaxID=1404 RepID=UPI00210164FF|nr:hypothetical protein [Priestia megaterium]
MSFRLSRRDKDIIAFINQFRAVDRDSLVDLFFKQLKSPVNACNSVMVRLYRLGVIERTQQYSPTVYLPVDAKIKKNSQKILISFLFWMSINKCVRIAHLNKSLSKISPPNEKEELNRIFFVFLKDLPFGLKFNVISIPNRKCRRRLTSMRSFSFHRYAVASDHIRIIQVASIHELMEKYKSPAKSQKEARTKTAPSSGGIRINLT